MSADPRVTGCHAGVTLIELLVTMIVGVIVVLALTLPFVAERRFWKTGKQQTDAQRDAQLVMRAFAKAAHEASSHNIGVGATAAQVTLNVTCNDPARTVSTRQMRLVGGNQIQLIDNCPGKGALTLIDGTRSQVLQFGITGVSSKVLRVSLQVAQGQQTELLNTEIFLRNAP